MDVSSDPQALEVLCKAAREPPMCSGKVQLPHRPFPRAALLFPACPVTVQLASLGLG